MKSRFIVFTVLAAALLLSTGAGCRHEVPPRIPIGPYGPDSTWTGVLTVYKAAATISRGAIRYVMDWGDDAIDTTDTSYASGETATVSHIWTAPGTASIHVQAINAAFTEKTSEWSPVKSVKVIANDRPVVDWFGAPPVGIRGIEDFFELKGHDPAGDSIRFHIDWGDSSDTTTSFDSSPCSVFIAHVYTSTGSFTAVADAEDIHGVRSEPESLSVVVGTAGGVIWYWWSKDPENEEGPPTTSPLILDDGFEEWVYAGCESDHKFYAIRAGNGRDARCATTRWPGHVFTGHSAFCEQTGHIIVGADDGRLYAFTLNLQRAWYWPEGESLAFFEWGAPAIKDDRLYVPSSDDSVFYLIDSVDHGVRVAAFAPQASFVDAPAIDAQGNVYFGTDSGYLYKMGPELDTVFWRTRLLVNGEIHSPAIGGDGRIYCASDSFRLYAIDPATGIASWTVTLEGDVFRPAIGQSAIFVGSSFGKAYSIDLTTGDINWQKTLKTPYGADEQFSTTPIVTANGYVYIQSENDVLYCVNQADGTVIWYCDCPRYLPRTGGSSHRPRKTQLTGYAPNPTILSNGNIIVPGGEALYCVAGYPERPLDPLAQWPKWQHDVYNTGYVGGGR